MKVTPSVSIFAGIFFIFFFACKGSVEDELNIKRAAMLRRRPTAVPIHLGSTCLGGAKGVGGGGAKTEGCSGAWQGRALAPVLPGVTTLGQQIGGS